MIIAFHRLKWGEERENISISNSVTLVFGHICSSCRNEGFSYAPRGFLLFKRGLYKTQKQLKCPSMDQENVIYLILLMHNKAGDLAFVTMWMKLKTIMPIRMSHIQEDKY